MHSTINYISLVIGFGSLPVREERINSRALPDIFYILLNRTRITVYRFNGEARQYFTEIIHKIIRWRGYNSKDGVFEFPPAGRVVRVRTHSFIWYEQVSVRLRADRHNTRLRAQMHTYTRMYMCMCVRAHFHVHNLPRVIFSDWASGQASSCLASCFAYLTTEENSSVERLGLLGSA